MKTTAGARGFTLIELITAVTVLGVIAAVLLPIINGAADSYTAASELRTGSEQVGYAMDRCLQTLRETPAGATHGTVDIATATATKITFGDGHGIEFADGVLWLRDSASSTSPLCRNVTDFTIYYVGSDGTTNTMSAPANTHRYYVKVTAANMTLYGGAFPRVLVVKP
jgi:prepilin-type N-terminal cleavage/methylation domain-containing protein